MIETRNPKELASRSKLHSVRARVRASEGSRHRPVRPGQPPARCPPAAAMNLSQKPNLFFFFFVLLRPRGNLSRNLTASFPLQLLSLVLGPPQAAGVPPARTHPPRTLHGAPAAPAMAAAAEKVRRTMSGDQLVLMMMMMI